MKKEYRFILSIISIGLVIGLISHFFYQICFVQGSSMEPTLKDKDVLLIKKYQLNLTYNDIVVIKKEGKILIKRIIGLPNDTIVIKEYPYVNNEQFDNRYIENQGDINTITLKMDEYYVLGDNRQESIDSRFNEIGIIKRSEIIGKKI